MIEVSSSTLRAALARAIESQEKYEKEVLGYRLDSGMVKAWRELVNALENGETIIIKRSET